VAEQAPLVHDLPPGLLQLGIGVLAHAGIKGIEGHMVHSIDVARSPGDRGQAAGQVTRVIRRPDRVLRALRLLEVLTAVTAMGQRVSPADLGAFHEALAAKQAADVVGFLVSAAALNTGFRDRARSLLLGEPVAEYASGPGIQLTVVI
jgi:hypothetical protein